MPLIVCDFETYYDSDFSLSKMTTEEYIRSPRFEVIGVSVKVDSEPPRWFSGTMPDIQKWLLRFPWETSIAVAHNAAFDMAILNWSFGIIPARIADTLSMARAIDGPDAGNSLAKLAERHGLGAKGNEVINALGKRRLDFSTAQLAAYGEYCCNDADLTYDLFQKQVAGFPLSELRVIDLTIRMFTEPVLRLSQPVLDGHLTEVLDRKAKLLDGLGVSTEALMSNDKLAKVLADLGVEPPTKTSPTTGKVAWAFAKNDEGFKALLEHEDERVQAIVAARLGIKSTLEETRTERFIDISKRGTLPVPLRYYAAHTGRWGGDDKINLQNLPRKSPLKKSMRAPKGFLLVDCDSSQIEARTLAWLAGQDDLVQFFEKNNAEIAAGVAKADMQFDPYKIMASGIYGVPVSEVTDDMRFVGKTTILGCIAEGTPVLTDRGWVAIEEVTTSDRLWDGEEWVCHQGLVQKGTKETLSLCGLWLTPDHKVLCGTQWLQAHSVVQDRNTLSQALDTGAVSWLCPDTSKGQGEGYYPSSCGATAGSQNTPLIGTTSRTSKAPDAPSAVDGKDTENVIGSIYRRSPTLRTESDCSTDYRLLSAAATHPITGCTQTTEVGVSQYTNSGELTAPSSYGTSKQCPGGTTQSSIWTVQTTTGGMNPETSGLSLGRKTTPTEERSAFSRRNLMTYDIAYAGPRNRYTVATDAGPIIVHNCGYGMGAAKFQGQLKNFNVDMDLEECKRIITVYRRTYPRIVEFWDKADMALEAMMQGMTAPLDDHGVLLVGKDNSIRLPNSLLLRYDNLRKWVDPKDGKTRTIYDTKKGKSIVPKSTWGGAVTENVCQAVARIIIAWQMLKIAEKYKVAMTVHDSVVAVVPEAEADEARKYIETCMQARPPWAKGLPLNCESKMGETYGG
jgi:DNA polymerase I-like protein with 3'-5' exonuclease and polymerase domains